MREKKGVLYEYVQKQIEKPDNYEKYAKQEYSVYERKSVCSRWRAGNIIDGSFLEQKEWLEVGRSCGGQDEIAVYNVRMK